MSMDTQRLILLFIFSFSLLMLWEAWDKQNRPQSPPAPSAQQAPGAPGEPVASDRVKPPAATVPGADAAAKGESVRVSTDLLVADIDMLGGTLKRLELLQHKSSKHSDTNLVLLGPAHQYEAQSGLAGEGGPNHRTLWRAEPGER